MEPLFIKDFLPQQIFNFVQSYCLIKYGNLKHFKGSVDTQSNSLIGEYSDFVMETLITLSRTSIQMIFIIGTRGFISNLSKFSCAQE